MYTNQQNELEKTNNTGFVITVYIVEQQALIACFLFYRTGINWFKLVYGPFGQSNIHCKLAFCHAQPGRN
jgi:hypothetical protein